jgi:hypothetical protein
MCDARHPAVHAHERAKEFQTQWARFQDSLRAGRNHTGRVQRGILHSDW